MNATSINKQTGEIYSYNPEDDINMTTENQILAPQEIQDQLNQTVQTVPSKSKKRFVDEMIYLVGEIEAVNESLKDLKQQAKDQGYNPALLLAVAKAIAAGKGEELEDKSKATLEILDEVLADLIS